MKDRTRIIALIALVCLAVSGYTYVERWTERQNAAHEIAELARGMGLPESDPIIVRAQEIWLEDAGAGAGGDGAPPLQEEPETTPVAEPDPVPEDELPTPWYTQTDIDIVASVVYNEAAYGTTERHKELTAAVVVNRVHDARFPATVYGVVTQPYQYCAAYATYGSYYMTRAMQSTSWDYCCEIAERTLRGEVVCPANVVFQANFRQGTGVYEIGYTSYSTTYFCYG